MDRKQNLKPWPKGVSGNPGGRPKHDLAAEIARVVFESDPEAVRKAFLTRLRRGDSRAFAVLADRGYGKLTEHAHAGRDRVSTVWNRGVFAELPVRPHAERPQ